MLECFDVGRDRKRDLITRLSAHRCEARPDNRSGIDAHLGSSRRRELHHRPRKPMDTLDPPAPLRLEVFQHDHFRGIASDKAIHSLQAFRVVSGSHHCPINGRKRTFKHCPADTASRRVDSQDQGMLAASAVHRSLVCFSIRSTSSSSKRSFISVELFGVAWRRARISFARRSRSRSTSS